MKSKEVQDFYKYLGKLIADKRNSRSITQEQLAKKTGLTRGTLAAIEYGVIRIDFLRLRTLATALKFNLEEIK